MSMGGERSAILCLLHKAELSHRVNFVPRNHEHLMSYNCQTTVCRWFVSSGKKRERSVKIKRDKNPTVQSFVGANRTTTELQLWNARPYSSHHQSSRQLYCLKIKWTYRAVRCVTSQQSLADFLFLAETAVKVNAFKPKSHQTKSRLMHVFMCQGKPGF